MATTTKKPTKTTAQAETDDAALAAKIEEYRRDIPPGQAEIEAELRAQIENERKPPVHLYAAILKAQAKIETVRKNGENPHFRSKYATLDEIWETIRKAVNDAGLVVFCTIEPGEDGKKEMRTHVAEATSGEEISCAFPIVTQNVGPQAIGSAMTYARRYTLTALLEIVTGDGADDDGEAAAHDVYGEVLAPSTEYAVTDEVDLSDIVLGSIHTLGDGASAKKLMLTQVQINTQAGNPPTVTISGVEVESGATAKRTYAITGTLTPRSKAQDVCGAFTASANFTQINTTAAVDPHVQTVKGVPVASDASHGRIEVQATMTDGAGNGTITAASAGGFTVTASPAETDPDANYITRAATATKYLIGTEAA